MKKRVWFIIIVTVAVMCLCSCGNDTGISGTQSASGDAVTGSVAASGSVLISGSAAASGSTVSGRYNTSEEGKADADDIVQENLTCSKRSPYRNAGGYYEKTENGCIQRKPDGTFVREISFGESGTFLCSVTDSELFFVKLGNSDDGEYVEELWSMPIEETENGDRPSEKDARFILKDETVSWGSYFYANEDYIVYIVPYDFKVYDRKAEKYLKLKGEPQDKKCPPNNAVYMSDCVCGNNIIFQCKHDGLYRYELGSDKIVPIDKRTHGAYSAVVYEKGNQIIYERCDACEEHDKGAEDHQVSWYLYDCGTGERQKLVTEAEWKKLYKENGLKESEVLWGLARCMDGEDLLYFLDDNCGVSLDMSGDRTPHYEKEFSEWLKKSKYDYWDIKDIEDGKCFITEEDDEEGEEYVVGYYDMKENSYVKTDRFCRW